MKLINSKQVAQEKEFNLQLREIRKQKYIQNMEQKKIFEHLIRNNLQLDLKKPEQAKIIANGVPEIYRELIWTQLLKNNHGITPKFYELLTKKVVKLSTEIMQVERNEELQQIQLHKAKSQGYAPSQQINLNLQKISKWLSTIKQDIPRTFSQLKIFQSLAPPPQPPHLPSNSGQNPKSQSSSSISSFDEDKEKQPPINTINNESRALFNILSCWVAYRDDIGYRQGMSQIAGYLFIELNSELRAFQIFCSLITTDTLSEFFTMNLPYISSFCQKVHSRLRQRNDQLYDFLDTHKIDYKLFVLDWMFSLFTKCFELDTIGKVWDVLLLNGMDERVLVNVVVEIVCAFEEEVLGFDDGGQVDAMGVCMFLKRCKVDEVRESGILQQLKDFNL